MVEKAETIDEFENGNITRQRIKVGDLEYIVYGSKRIEPYLFKTYCFCDLCDPKRTKFISKVIRIPKTDINVCQNCICNMEEALKEATLSDYRKKRSDNQQ
jgi:hypothetical protein